MNSRIIKALTAAAVLLCICPSIGAQDISAQEKRRARLQKEIAQLELQIKENSAKSTSALRSLTLVRKQVSNRKELLAESRREIAVLTDSIASVQAEARALGQRLDTLSLYYGNLVKTAYKNRDARLWYGFILSSGNIAQASRRYSYLRSLSSRMNAYGSDIKTARQELASKIETLDSLKAGAEELRREREKELGRLQGEEKKADQLVASLKRDKNKYQKQLAEDRRQVQALNKEIERIIAQALEESRKAGTSSSSSGSKPSSAPAKPIDYKLAGKFEADKGKLPWPADGPVVESFGRHRHPVYTNLEMPANNGVNIGLAKGSSVYAVYDGEVKRVIVMPGYNKCVLVQHGNYFTFYCKLSEVAVKAGDKVSVSQRIGTVDTIDGQTQLHFEVWKEKTPQNPETWLRPR